LGSSVSSEEIIEPIMISTLERPEVSNSSVNPDNFNTSDPDASNPDRAARQDFLERRIQSGKASPSFSANNTGDNVNVCPTGPQAVNTGKATNQQGVTQYSSATDDMDLLGSSITVDSLVSTECTHTIEQMGATGK
jgi:hypothetical protein